mgnify:CR=1 FL=1
MSVGFPSTKAIGSAVLSHFPPVDFAFSYGSAVKPQLRSDGSPLVSTASKSTSSAASSGSSSAATAGKMMDFVFAVRDPVAWHAATLERFPRHYSLLGRLCGARAVSAVQSLGAGVYFNPLVQLPPGDALYGDALPMIKYGVVSTRALQTDLTTWDRCVSATDH